MVILLVSSRQGSTGSYVLCLPLANLSQAKNTIHSTTEMHNMLITTADLHENSVPPSSNAETRRTEAASNKKVPKKSTFRTAAISKEENMLCDVSDR